MQKHLGKIRKLTGVILLTLTFNIYAISEFHYQAGFENLVVPFMQSMEDGSFESNGIILHYKKLIKNNSTSSKCLVILPGRGESAEQYSELAYDLNQSHFGNNLNIFILDHRGQGKSQRLAWPKDMGHIDHFDNYVSDLDYFLKNIVDKEKCNKKFLFAHSMGAGIGLSYLTDHPNYFIAAGLSSPMLKIQTSPFPYEITRMVVSNLVANGKGDMFAYNQSGFDPNETFYENDYTNSRARFNMMMSLYEQFPETQIGEVSNRWIYEVMNGTDILRSNYKKITTPIALYRADDEPSCNPDEMIKLCQELNSCKDHFLTNSKHAIFNDSDIIRKAAIKSLLKFFERF